MIQVTRLNGTQIFVNAELIQTVESTPDTIISLTTNVKMVVHETAQEVVDKIIDYRRQAYATPRFMSSRTTKKGE